MSWRYIVCSANANTVLRVAGLKHRSVADSEAVIGAGCMTLLTKALALLLLSVIAGAVYAARLAVLYIGSDILQTGWRLLRQGSIDRVFRLANG